MRHRTNYLPIGRHLSKHFYSLLKLSRSMTYLPCGIVGEPSKVGTYSMFIKTLIIHITGANKPRGHGSNQSRSPAWTRSGSLTLKPATHWHLHWESLCPNSRRLFEAIMIHGMLETQLIESSLSVDYEGKRHLARRPGVLYTYHIDVMI